MIRSLLKSLSLMLIGVLLSGCLGQLWTGASFVYDRHHFYKKISDYKLYINTTNALFIDKRFKTSGAKMDIAVFNGDVLVAGHLPSIYLLQEARRRLKTLKGYRRLFNALTIIKKAPNTAYDAWITAKIRAQIFADSAIDPNAFKVVTSDAVVYIMGDVKADEAEKVIQIARHTEGVKRVMKILRYFTYKDSNNMA